MLTEKPVQRRCFKVYWSLALAFVCLSFGNSIAQPSRDKATLVITDFTNASPDLGWRVVNDNVMGGRSDGGFRITDGELYFTGRTNTRGGGFSSIRSARHNVDLSLYAGIRVRVLGDGRRYTWRLTSDARYYGRELAYWADFDTVAGELRDVSIPFERFVPRFRGSVLKGPALDLSKIEGMGLMIYDNLDGPFSLKLQTIEAYSSTEQSAK